MLFQAIIVRINKNILGKSGIEQPGEDPLLDPGEVLVRRHNRRKLLVVAVIDQLIELFTRPWSRLLSAEVIEHEESSILDLLKTLVVSDTVLRIESRPQLIEQVGHDPEIDPNVALIDHMIGDRCCQVGFAYTTVTVKKKPTFRVLRIAHRGVVRRCHIP